MNTKIWHFIINTFEVATRGNYKAAVTLSTHLDAALFAAKADAQILVLYNYYHPIHLAYVAAYNAWLAQGGTQKGSTQSLTALLAGLTAKVNAWDFQIQGTYTKGTPSYTALLPQGHTPFFQGGQSQRIAAVHALDTALTGIVALAATKTDVDNYATSLDTANTTQKGSKTSTIGDSTAVETQRINMTNGQMYCYGGLVQKYTTQLNKIEQFYDMEIVRNGSQTDFTGHVAAGEHKNIAKRTLVATQAIKLKNLDSTVLRFYLATQKNDAVGVIYIEVPPMTELSTTAKLMGDVTTQHFINVFNVDITQQGAWELMLE